MKMPRKPTTKFAKSFRSDTGGTVKIGKATTGLTPPKQRSGFAVRKGKKGF